MNLTSDLDVIIKHGKNTDLNKELKQWQTVQFLPLSLADFRMLTQ